MCPLVDTQQDVFCLACEGLFQFGLNGVYCGLHLFLVAPYHCLHIFLNVGHLMLVSLYVFFNCFHFISHLFLGQPWLIFISSRLESILATRHSIIYSFHFHSMAIQLSSAVFNLIHLIQFIPFLKSVVTCW
jgi:hypothetical protein